jgi:hypothetical protein
MMCVLYDVKSGQQVANFQPPPKGTGSNTE